MKDLFQTETPKKLYELTKEQKIKLMQVAASDPDYLERCYTIQKEFNEIEKQQ